MIKTHIDELFLSFIILLILSSKNYLLNLQQYRNGKIYECNIIIRVFKKII